MMNLLENYVQSHLDLDVEIVRLGLELRSIEASSESVNDLRRSTERIASLLEKHIVLEQGWTPRAEQVLGEAPEELRELGEQAAGLQRRLVELCDLFGAVAVEGARDGVLHQDDAQLCSLLRDLEGFQRAYATYAELEADFFHTHAALLAPGAMAAA